MLIYVLKPLNNLKVTPKEIHIRAASRQRARIIAAESMSKTMMERGGGYFPSPDKFWLEEKLSTCEIYIGEKYNEQGKEGVLYPVDLKQDWEERNK